MIKRLIPFLLLFGLIQACTTAEENHFVHSLAKEYNQPILKKFDSTAYYLAFDSIYTLVKPQLKNPNWMADFYKADDQKTIILQQNLLNRGIDTLSYFLNRVEEHGIRASYYNQMEIKSLLTQLRETKFNRIEEVYPVIAKLELYANDAFIAYSNMLRFGAINPKHSMGRYFDEVMRPTEEQSKAAVLRTDWAAYLDSIQPQSAYYLKFQKLLQETPSTDLERKEALYLALEKLRWKSEDFPDQYLLVNIPEQMLRIMENGEIKQQMRVCIGETDYAPYSRKGDNHETPILSGIINRMQVNPVWNIPQSIVKKEILEKLISNPSYLESKNMVAYNKKGKLVDALNTDWSSDSVKSFSFKQNPGMDNSLGNIKFIFTNPYAIYLHDTPAKGAFGAKNRAVSHGCVRVEKPMELAAYLVNDEKEAERIKMETQDSVSTSRWVSMKKGVPVFMTYYTLWFDKNGDLSSYPDIYGMDERVYAVLKKYFPNGKK